MWVGSNVLEINEATLIVALQYWLDNKVLNKDEKSPIVKGIKPNTQYPGCGFRVELSEKE